MTKFETNQIDVNGDGRVIVYQRADVKGMPKWQMRFGVPKPNDETTEIAASVYKNVLPVSH